AAIGANALLHGEQVGRNPGADTHLSTDLLAMQECVGSDRRAIGAIDTIAVHREDSIEWYWIDRAVDRRVGCNRLRTTIGSPNILDFVQALSNSCSEFLKRTRSI